MSLPFSECLEEEAMIQILGDPFNSHVCHDIHNPVLCRVKREGKPRKMSLTVKVGRRFVTHMSFFQNSLFKLCYRIIALYPWLSRKHDISKISEDSVYQQNSIDNIQISVILGDNPLWISCVSACLEIRGTACRFSRLCSPEFFIVNSLGR